jgi:hypothetical protein
MSVMEYATIGGRSKELLDDAFSFVFIRMANRFPHLADLRFIEQDGEHPFDDYVRPESLVGLTALDVALGLMRLVNPRKIAIDRWMRWDGHTLIANMDLTVDQLVPALELAFYKTAPIELWSKPDPEKPYFAREETWNVVTKTRPFFTAQKSR